MSPTIKFFAIVLMSLVAIHSLTCIKARPVVTVFSTTDSHTLTTRLNLDTSSTNCWESLFKLQACSGEVLQFFYNGETYMGPECCHAVHIIVHDCWPAMLNSLGFTSEEGDLLRVYCDGQAQHESSPKPPGPLLVNGPFKDEIIVEKNN